MKVCPNCGKSSSDTSVFCEECGSELVSENKAINTVNMGKTGNNAKKIKVLKILGVLSMIIAIFSFSGAFNSVKEINADRMLLYPMLSAIISYYSAFKLVEYEETWDWALIVVIVPTIFLVIAAFLLSSY